MKPKPTEIGKAVSYGTGKQLNGAPFLLFAGDDERVHVLVMLHAKTIWLTLAQMAELFDVGVPAISKHLKNIFETGELEREATVSKLETVQTEGERQVRRLLEYYNLDAIIAVGYRVNSRRATQFRIWATGVLNEFIEKSFVLDDDRLKQGKLVFGEDYFRELLYLVPTLQRGHGSWTLQRPVGASGRWSVRTCIHAGAGVARMQPARRRLFGRQAWSGGIRGTAALIHTTPHKTPDSARQAFARDQRASRWAASGLRYWDRDILQDAGMVSTELAKAHAESEFETYRITQDRQFESDFDRVVQAGKALAETATPPSGKGRGEKE